MKGIDDIGKDSDKEKIGNIKREAREELNDFMGGIMDDFDDLLKRRKIEKENKENKKKKSIWQRIQNGFFWLFIIGLLIMVVNFLLGNIWLLKFFIGDLF